MYLTRLTLNLKSQSVRRDLADCWRMHRTIMAAFPLVEGDGRLAHKVLHRVEPAKNGARRLHLLVQSESQPDWKGLPAHYLAEGEAPEVKSIGEQLASVTDGMVLNFRLRANPTRKVDTKSGPDGVRRNGRRKKVQGEEEQLNWLLRKASVAGFSLIDVRRNDEGGEFGSAGDASSARRNELFFGSVLFEGTLRVTDSNLFLSALRDGVGSGKAFGFGLLSIAPART